LRKGKLFFRTNTEIRAPQLRVIGEDGKQVGVISRDEALAQAQKASLDLVEIAPKANPPVAKIVNIGKFLYQEEKKLKEQQKKAKAGELKEVRFSPFIAEGDFNTRIERVKEFLGEKNKVKLTVVFKGRQMGSKSFGYELFKRVLGILGDSAHVDMEGKFIGRHLSMVISPTGKGKINAKSEDKKVNNKEV
jgi:translation initiation factor IF-3